jgi:hypothetical protein
MSSIKGLGGFFETARMHCLVKHPKQKQKSLIKITKESKLVQKYIFLFLGCARPGSASDCE